jgi:hypothetical protein
VIGGDDPGAAVEGAFIVVDGEVRLTDRDGHIVRDHNGRTYQKKITNGDTPKQIAARLTKEMRSILRGKDSAVSGFSDPINYPKPRTGRYFI